WLYGQPVVCRALGRVVVSMCKYPAAPLLFAGPGNPIAMSLRYWLYTGCPSTCPSMVTQIVEPSARITYGCWVSAQPKLITVPDTVAPCPGVSSVPNGLVACALSTVIVRVPKSTAEPALL